MKRQGSPAPLSHLVPLIGLDEGVLMTLEEPVPQLLLVSLVQLEFHGPVVVLLLVGVDMPYQGAAQCQGGNPSMPRVPCSRSPLARVGGKPATMRPPRERLCTSYSASLVCRTAFSSSRQARR